MRKLILANFAVVLLLVINSSVASKDHGDEKKVKPKASQHNEHDEDNHESDGPHDEEAEHNHDDAKHEEIENPQVGPDKGILAASEKEGIKLSPQAEKNFDIQKIKFSTGTFEIPKQAIVTAGLEVNLYRYREGYYKRIDFEQISRSGNKISIRSKDLKSGDEIATSGLGFLRIAELAAFGGAPEGHSH